MVPSGSASGGSSTPGRSLGTCLLFVIQYEVNVLLSRCSVSRTAARTLKTPRRFSANFASTCPDGSLTTTISWTFTSSFLP